MLSLFDLFAFLMLLTAAFGWLNQIFFHLPSNIGLLLMGVVAALAVLLVDVFFPGIQLVTDIGNVLKQIDFYEAVMHGMLAFLLFAGALHVDWTHAEAAHGSGRRDGDAGGRNLDLRGRLRFLGTGPAVRRSTSRWPGRWCSAR